MTIQYLSKPHTTIFQPGQGCINFQYYNGEQLSESLVTCTDPIILENKTFEYLRGSLETIFTGISKLPSEMLEYLSDHRNPISIHKTFAKSIQPKKHVTCFYDFSQRCFRIALIQDRGVQESSLDPRYLPLQPNSLLFMVFYAAAYNMLNHEYPQSHYLQYPIRSGEYGRYTSWKTKILEFKSSFYVSYKTDIRFLGTPQNSEFALPSIHDSNFQDKLTSVLSLMIAHFFSADSAKIKTLQECLPNSMISILGFLISLDQQPRAYYKLIMNNKQEVMAIPAQRSPLL